MATKHRLNESVFPSASKEEIAKMLPSFTVVVMYIMEKKKITRRQLIKDSGLLKCIIGRVLSYKNCDKFAYKPDSGTICSVCVGLKINYEDYEIVKYITDLVGQKMKSILDRGLSIEEANFELEKEKLPLLGSQSR